MLTDKQKQSLTSYLGFATRKKAIFVGMKMEEMLGKKKANYLFLLPSCTPKKEQQLAKYKEKNPKLIIFRYKGAFPIQEVLGYELLNAFVLTDDNLANAILSTLKADEEMK